MTLDPTGYATLVLNEIRIPLSNDTDTHALLAEILDAVVAGGGIVHLVSRYGRACEVLVTPSTQALISHPSESFEEWAPDMPWVSSINLDY